MRLSKFDFPHKTVDLTRPEQVKAALQRERLNKPGNFAVINNYFFMEEFLREIIKRSGNDVVLSGGNAVRALTEPYRVPTDIDIDIQHGDANLKRFIDMVKGIAADDWEADYTVSEPKRHSERVHKLHVDADLYGLYGGFDIDAVERFPQSMRKGTVQKVISTDEEYDAIIPSGEEIVGNKINRLIWMVSRPDIESFPIRDFYDIYKICEGADLDMGKLKEFVRYKVMESNIVYLDSKRDARDNMPVLVSPYMEKKWKKFGKQNVISESDTLDKITDFTTGLIAEMDF